ncbi:MAG: peptide chain release factor N(5)-glutamine methyltransferase [Steroidobacteraceae bacterium]
MAPLPTTADLLSAALEALAAPHGPAPDARTRQLEAELLLAHVLDAPRARLKSHPEEPRSAGERGCYLALVERRRAGEPLAYLVGRKAFWSLDLSVGPQVLVPRPETELLVERALALRPEPTGTAADLGTGSGAIALALASERPGWQITATDLSEEALRIARHNASRLGARNVQLLHGDWFAPLAARRVHLVVSNPPYIAGGDPVLAAPPLVYEPRMALSPGRDPMTHLLAIIRTAPRHLEPGGWLLLEHGATQAEDVARELVARGFNHVRSHRDLAGHARMTEARWE